MIKLKRVYENPSPQDGLRFWSIVCGPAASRRNARPSICG